MPRPVWWQLPPKCSQVYSPAYRKLCEGRSLQLLQEAGWARRRAAEEAARKGEQSGQPAAKKKRKRKVRYPKGFDPANPGPPPNPERWLPKWQRSELQEEAQQAQRERCAPQNAGRMHSILILGALLWLFWILQAV